MIEVVDGIDWYWFGIGIDWYLLVLVGIDWGNTTQRDMWGGVSVLYSVAVWSVPLRSPSVATCLTFQDRSDRASSGPGFFAWREKSKEVSTCT
jgi:hypothetical protein